MHRTFVAAAIIAAITLLSVDCTNHGPGQASPPPPVVTPYTAYGASNAVGVGATQCPTAGTPPMQSPVSCPAGRCYHRRAGGVPPKPAARCPYTTAIARRPITPSDAAAMHLWRY